MALLEISIVPVGTANTSVSDYIAGALKILKDKGINYELNSMGTTIEGELGSILDVAGQMHESCFKQGAKRVVTTIKIDDRKDKPLSIEGKKASVNKKLKI